MKFSTDSYLMEHVMPDRASWPAEDRFGRGGRATPDCSKSPVALVAQPVERRVFSRIVGRSEAMHGVLDLARRAAGSTVPVLIEGESGVGKEVVARAIAENGARSGQPFVVVNCGALPEHLVESILFGHEKGAFTGASERRAGKFLEADGGTLFLDEISELPLSAQVKLLRALQEGEVDPVGARRPVKADFRLVAATNRSLAELVRRGRFREDLFYRLNVFPIAVPALRIRREDVKPLAEHFAKRFAAQEGKPLEGISRAAMKMLVAHSWPGNVRQLENAVLRAVVLADEARLEPEHFPDLSLGAQAWEAPKVETEGLALVAPENLAERAGMPAESVRRLWAVEPGRSVPAMSEDGEVRRMEEVEADLIRIALAHYRGHMTDAARHLGIGRSTLYRRVRELGLEP